MATAEDTATSLYGPGDNREQPADIQPNSAQVNWREVSFLLQSDNCLDCARLREQSGGRCPACDGELDMRDSPAGDVSPGNFHLLQAAFIKVERGHWGFSRFAEEVAPILQSMRHYEHLMEQCAAQARSRAGITAQRSLRNVRARMEETRHAFMLCLNAAQQGDILTARRHLDNVRVLMSTLEVLGRNLTIVS